MDGGFGGLCRVGMTKRQSANTPPSALNNTKGCPKVGSAAGSHCHNSFDRGIDMAGLRGSSPNCLLLEDRR